MRRGTVNEYFYNSTLKDGTVKRRGPFFNIMVSAGGNKSISQSVSKKDVDRIKQYTDNYRRFRELTDEYADVCDKITILTDLENADEANKN